jgi:RecB family exonuclease
VSDFGPDLNAYDYLTLDTACLSTHTGTPWATRLVVEYAARTPEMQAELDASVAQLAIDGYVTLTPAGPEPTPAGLAYCDRVRQRTSPPVRAYTDALDSGATVTEAWAHADAATGHAESRAAEVASRAVPNLAQAVDRPATATTAVAASKAPGKSLGKKR